MMLLAAGAERLGISLDQRQLLQFQRLADALVEHNQRVNLTSITDPDAIQVRHFLDSLTAALPLLDRLRAGEPLRLVDVGTGAGFPGLALKIAFPALQVTLVEATGKKTRFLAEVVEQLGMADVAIVTARSEDAARDPAHRERYDWATGRALGSLPAVVELCAPFLGHGGVLVAQRRGDLEAEIKVAARAFRLLNLRPRPSVLITLPGLDDGRGLVVADKVGPTPGEYPRRVGVPARQPL